MKPFKAAAAIAVLAPVLLLPAALVAQDDPALTPDAEPPKAREEAAAAAATETRVASLQAREVIEQLKTMRAQLLLDEEYNRLLEARVKRMELEQKLGGGARDLKGKGIVAPRRLESGSGGLVVKSVTTTPFKEAFVVYKGRTYTVRPGDKLGDISIRDINENGVVTNRASVVLEQ